jgi:hypothetical protein
MDNMKRKTVVLMKVVWVALCIHMLLFYWLNQAAWTDSEQNTLYFLKMTALSFPLSLLVVTVGEGIILGLAKIGLDFTAYFNQQATVVIIWLSMVVAGFLQWFIVVPFMYRKVLRYLSGK